MPKMGKRDRWYAFLDGIVDRLKSGEFDMAKVRTSNTEALQLMGYPQEEINRMVRQVEEAVTERMKEN